MSNLGERLKDLRTANGLTQTELAKVINERYSLKIDRVMISKWETGFQVPVMNTIACLARYFNVSIDYLNGAERASPSSAYPEYENVIPMPEMTKVPLLGTIACGEPILAEENIDEYINMPKEYKGTFALRCKGDSMINARIFDGDIVYIREQLDVEDGEIAAVLIDNEATLKKVRKYPNKIALCPCNPLYDEMVYTHEDINQVRIIGKAVAFLSTVR